MNRQRLLQSYIWTIIAIGAAACLFSAYHLPFARLDLPFLLLAIVTVGITSRISIQIPLLTSEVTVSDTFIFLTLLLYGGEPATLVAAADAICTAMRISKKPRTILYNGAVLACATFTTSQVQHFYFRNVRLADHEFSGNYLISLCLMVVVQYVVNSGLASLYEAIRREQSVWQTWRKHYLWTSITYVVGASCAAITTQLIYTFGFYTIIATTPIIGIIYFTYRTYLKNIETAEEQAELARRHVEELNRYIAEQERIREQFSQVEKMSALGQLASGVAHDFNNSLAAILGRAELMLKRAEDPKMRRSLEIIIKSAHDGARTVKRIQDFARQRREHDFELVSVDQMLLDVSEITRPRWKDRAEAASVHINLELRNHSNAHVMGDVSELRDVLVNMIFNAVDAMPEGGQLTLSAEEVDGTMIMSVSDTGVGMSPEVRSRVFDPFFTTKGVEGMGLGLAVSYGVIRRHEGTIDIESEIGHGTTFKIRLPAVKVESNSLSNSESEATRKNIRRMNMAKILVVDDEDRVRFLLGEILEDEGYEAMMASSAREGLQLFDAHHFDAVFTDVGMPGMSGWELVSAIRKRNQHIPVAVITGWGEAVSNAERNAAQVDWVLTKPFTMAQISDIAQEVERRRTIVNSRNIELAAMVA